ncbi:MAG: polyvinylalcohol dehydrogenase [Pirellula sp.]|nr:polyvinylalcohol dehydrogenase [Pirellula sp.]
MRSRVSFAALLTICFPAAALLAAAPSNVTLPADQWPQWRGPNRDAVSSDTGLLQQWPEDEKGPKLAQKITGLGGGFSSVAIADGRILTMGDVVPPPPAGAPAEKKKKDGASTGEQYVMAFDAATGKNLWRTQIGPSFEQTGYHGSRCTPTIDGDRVYALGTNGDFLCLETATGKILWSKNFAKDFGGKMMSGWAYSESPLVDGNKVVCTPGGDDAGIVALDKLTGKEIWRSKLAVEGENGKDGAGYASIVISEGAGVKQYVTIVGRGCVGVDAETGKYLWGYNRVANPTANIPTPIVRGDYVFCTTGYGGGGAALLKLKKGAGGVDAEEVWYTPGKEFQNHHGGVVLLGDYLYCGNGHNKGFPVCVEFMTGKIVWDGGRGAGSGSAAIVAADGQVYFRYQDGTMALVEATPAGYKLGGIFKIPNVENPSWPHPVVAGGKLYLREQDNLFVYDVKK